MHWNSVQAANQERIFSPQTGPGIFGSAADRVSLGGMYFVPNVIRTGLKTIYKACSCLQRATERLSTSWQRLQIDITRGVQDALWHPAWLFYARAPLSGSTRYHYNNDHYNGTLNKRSSARLWAQVDDAQREMIWVKRLHLKNPESVTNRLFLLKY